MGPRRKFTTVRFCSILDRRRTICIRGTNSADRSYYLYGTFSRPALSPQSRSASHHIDRIQLN
jgi:hypothetical protein